MVYMQPFEDYEKVSQGKFFDRLNSTRHAHLDKSSVVIGMGGQIMSAGKFQQAA